MPKVTLLISNSAVSPKTKGNSKSSFPFGPPAVLAASTPNIAIGAWPLFT
jgi:hypothetical protein